MFRGLAVFAITYLLIVATRRLKFVRLDRPAGAIIGAVLAVATGAVTPGDAARAVDHTTIILLFAVMGMGAFLSLEGFFDRAGTWVIAKVRTPRLLMAAVLWGSGLLSAVVTNDAVCVLAAPLVVGWIARYRLPRLPLLMAIATGANTGSVATLVGNPQNMLCGSLGRLSFAQFSIHMLPVTVAALLVNHLLLLAFYAKQLTGDLPDEPVPAHVFTPRSLVTLGVIFGTVVVYTAGASLAFTALGGFAVLLVVHRSDPAEVWKRIDWSVLIFFGGLFVAVDAFARSGASEWFFSRVPLMGPEATLGSWLRAATVFLVGSNVVTNVPFILVVEGQMAHLPDATLGWELLAMASTFAGNLTLLGSVANVIVAEKAEDVGGLSFREHLPVGAAVGFTTTLVGTVLLVLVR